MGLIWFLIVGLVAGAVARAVVPGPDRMNLLQTLALGVVGSFVGGVIFAILSPSREILDFNSTGLIGSILGAIIALIVLRRTQRRGSSA